MKKYIGIDVGGTGVKAALVNSDGMILCSRGIPTGNIVGGDRLCDKVAALCRELCVESGISLSDADGIGIGLPGIVQDGVLVMSGNLRISDFDFRTGMEKRLGRRVRVENDANAAAYGEYMCGSGKGSSFFVMITLGTGIGGGIILGGRIHGGIGGSAAEIGHIIIESGGRKCACGKRGCFEAYCSATALVRDTKIAMAETPDSLMWKKCPDMRRVDGKVAFDACRQGDEAARGVIDTYLSHLCTGIENIIAILDPDVLCIGGGISNEGDALLLPLLEKLKSGNNLLSKTLPSTRICIATLGDTAGMIGAALAGGEKNEKV